MGHKYTKLWQGKEEESAKEKAAKWLEVVNHLASFKLLA